jgi:FSR family fosmidomycin resistance protein-like MFS transporter
MTQPFQKKRIITISIAHFFHDIYQAFFAPMLPLLMAQFGISLAAAGALDIARRAPSLGTPLIGLLADKKSFKYFIIPAPAITAIAMSLTGLAPSYWVLFLLLFIAGISAVCFHVPSPVLVKFLSGGKIGKGMSFYMSSGAIAGTAGTLLITFFITSFGISKSYLLMFFGVATSIILFYKLKDIPSIHMAKQKTGNTEYKSTRTYIPFFIFLGIIMLFRAGMTLSLTLYLPVYLTEKGNSLCFAGISLSILHLTGAAGMIAVGHISDHFSKKKILFILTLLASCAMWGLIYFSDNKLLILPCVIILGMLLFASAPIILALVQSTKSQRPAFVSSIYFSLGFFINVTGVLLVGFAGDNIGLETTFKICASIPVLSLPFIYFLQEK